MNPSSSPRILSVETGHAFAGGRFGIIEAAPETPSGSLIALNEFLREHQIQTFPGYTGEMKRPVLRLSGFSSRHDLDDLLQRQFPAWLREKGIDGADALKIPAAVAIAQAPFPHCEKVQETLGERVRRAGSHLPGLCYFAADAGLMFSGLTRPGQRDMRKMGAALSYNVAATNLLLFSGESSPKSTCELMAQLRPELGHPRIESAHEKAIDFLKMHPWQVSGIMNIVGLGLHTTSAMRREGLGSRIEAVGLAGALTGMTIQTLIPEKGNDSLIDWDHFLPEKKHASERMHRLIEAHPSLKPLAGVVRQLGAHPVELSGAISATANAGSIFSVLSQPVSDPGQLASSLLCLTGNAAQILLPQRGGASLDDLATATADVLKSRPQRASHADIVRASSIVVRNSGLRIGPRALTAAIEQRLAGGEDRGAAFEEPALRGNPFLPSRGMAEAGASRSLSSSRT